MLENIVQNDFFFQKSSNYHLFILGKVVQVITYDLKTYGLRRVIIGYENEIFYHDEMCSIRF